MADVSVRAARIEDAAHIARIQLDTWRQAYSEILPAQLLSSLTAERATEVWAQAISAKPSPRHHLFVALEQQWIVGFTALGTVDENEPPAAQHTAEAGAETDASSGIAGETSWPEQAVLLGPLLVEPRWGRRGHGSRLLAAAIDHARGDGARQALAWIPEADQASNTFLRGAGWAPDGYVRGLDTGGQQLREIRLHCLLD